jgi:rifampicin phosphotransferase
LDAPGILFFNKIAPEQLHLVGGKGLNLGRLARAGLPVPPGFVITTEAYRRREEEDLAGAILTAYQELGGGPVAVRSSATAEDLERASFAGQQETFLNVQGEQPLLDAIRRCWESLFAERAVAYRRTRGIPDQTVAMAVVVQRMVPADAAGVLFTRDPTDPAVGRMLVEAAWGLGEAVVSGHVTPDRWTLVHQTGEVLSAEIACKQVRITAAGEVEVPGDLQSQPCLSDEDLRGLAELGRQVEAEYGAPQDIEWALLDGRIFLLQSRPITAGVDEREHVRRDEIAYLTQRAEAGGTVWARYSLAEVLPEPLPFTWVLWKEFMSGQGGYGRMYRELGYDPDPCLDQDGILDLIAGRPYFNLSRDARLYFRNFPYDYPFEKLKANPELAIYPTPEANLARAPRGFLLKMVGTTRQMLAAEKTLERAAEVTPERLEREHFPRMQEFAQQWREADRSRLSERDLAQAFSEARAALFDRFAPQALKPSVLAGLAIQKLEAELKSKTGDAQTKATVERLLSGVSPEPPYDLAGGLRDLSAGTLSPELFLDRFGHRGPGEMELANPRWREMSSLECQMSNGSPPLHLTFDIRNLTLTRKASVYLERARLFTALRETAKHFLMLGYEVLRLLLLELDRRFDLQGGIFYLEPGELDRLIAGEDLRPWIAERRKRRALALGLEAPRVLFSDDLEAIGRRIVPAGAGEMLAGTGVSAGAAEGEALVLRSPDQAPPSARDFILVCPSTDPGWVPLFVRARGVVLETGGVLSHGAIVAREFGLPAVANISEACSRFRTGQRLRVDGSEGKVWMI